MVRALRKTDGASLHSRSDREDVMSKTVLLLAPMVLGVLHRFRAVAILVVAALVGCLIAIAAAISLSNPTLAFPPGPDRLELNRFLTSCDFSHRAKDDPIVHPGHAGMAHSHDFIGNRSTSADSTYESLRAAGSTCDLDGDTAAYWVPTLYQNGKALKPDRVLIYYKTHHDPERVRAFPRDLRMIAGDARATSPQPPKSRPGGALKRKTTC